jgi:hypothetical protein
MSRDGGLLRMYRESRVNISTVKLNHEENLLHNKIWPLIQKQTVQAIQSGKRRTEVADECAGQEDHPELWKILKSLELRMLGSSTTGVMIVNEKII